MKRICVLRDVRGVQQYIPVQDAVEVIAGEKLFYGDFTSGTVKDGPSGSHQRTVCDPVGPLTEVVVGSLSATTGKPADQALTECVLREGDGVLMVVCGRVGAREVVLRLGFFGVEGVRLFERGHCLLHAFSVELAEAFHDPCVTISWLYGNDRNHEFQRCLTLVHLCQ